MTINPHSEVRDVSGLSDDQRTAIANFLQGAVWRQLLLPVATIILAGLEPSSLVHHRAV
jgi:hypothetical protein